MKSVFMLIKVSPITPRPPPPPPFRSGRDLKMFKQTADLKKEFIN